MDSSHKFSPGSILYFILPSLLGLILFVTPIPIEEGLTIPIAVLAGWLQKWIGDYIPALMTGFIVLGAVGTVAIKIIRPDSGKNPGFIATLFDVTAPWMIARIIGAVFAVLTYFKLGPEIVYSDVTGGMLLYSLLTTLFAVFLFAGFLLPLLLNFGLLEFVGYSLTRVMRPLFKLPGRSSVDCLASWLGDATIGVLLTSRQYEEGFYTKKEAAIIGTSFSVVSVTFCLVVASELGMDNYFIPFYLTVIFTGIICALILPRIPPLSNKPDTYINDQPRNEDDEKIPAGYTPVSYGFEKAVLKAKGNKLSEVFTDGFKNVLEMWIGVAPIVMAMGTIALIIAEKTPVFDWIGLPFIPILELLQIPFAEEASSTIMIGFADMFLPAILGSGIESELTRFVIAALSVSQLIFISEVGGVLLGTKIPITMKDLFILYLLRTFISLPVIAGIAHLIF